MGIQKIGISSASAPGVRARIAVRADIAEQAAVHLVGAFRIAQPGVEIDTPAAAPAGSFETFYLQGFQRCLLQVRVSLYGMPGIDTEQMGLVAVPGIFIGPVVIPFLQMSVRADMIGPQA